MRFLHLTIMFFALAGFVLSAPALAQDAVSARTGSHKGYARLVFEWPSKPEYSLSKEGDRLKIRFSKAATLDAAGISASDSNIRKVEVLSSASEPLQVAVTIPSGSRFRDFVVASKLILDVYDSSDAEKPTQPAPTPEPATKAPKSAEKPAETQAAEPAPVKEEPATAPQPAETEPAPAPKGDFSRTPAESAKPAPVDNVESNSVPSKFEPHAITLTSTTSTGLAVFMRNGMLWVIVDNAELPSGPQITGPSKDNLPPLEKIEIPNGAAYRMDLPEGANVSAEGGGLSWRIALSPTAQKIPSGAIPVTEGGALEWPLREMRNIISFTDPMVGDTITVVTSPNATQSTGLSRDFVNLRTLDSVVGLAYVAKSDDVKATKTLDTVKVSRPEGLSLSAGGDMKPEQIRKAMNEEPAKEETPPAETHEEDAKHEEPAHAEEGAAPPDEHPEEAEGKHELEELAHKAGPAMSVEELAKAGEEKPTGNNIYNFGSWEMGGVQALDENMHVLMTELSNKKEESRPEDFMTMAKMNVANNRGAEALGLMRIALTKVPELEDNPEFNALRGAAMALSYKYDEAIIDFSREGVKKFDDIKYWTAYTLAGLEDWKQAISIMPKSFESIASYPSNIRIPLVLSFAEIALRGGDASLSKSILETLQPELGKLPLPYASNWNYLAGEAARQSGEPDKAIEYWEPLVKNGKDDLFRAKAGLSLTKLKLDQKKIKPNEAISTLEGLRYAWRGDELETLINFRLGQMYIDNKDYLKGLTVLRNATTLSPGSEMSRDIRDYMTRTFRDVFNNDRLKNISPLEAISLHEEFKDLLPPGEEGDRFVEKLAERLVDADLLGRAASLLEYQVNNRLQGDKKAEIAIRLAAIRLLDGNPDGALRSLEIAQDTLDKIGGVKPAETKPEDIKPEAGEASKAAPEKTTADKADPEKQRQIYLLKARALSMKKETDKAMAILEGMPPDADVNRLRTDIAWGAGRWEEAALALNDLITSEDISAKRPLTDYQRDLILNRAISLNLSGNRVALANLRERYNAQMANTTKGQVFEIVTRPRRADMIGSRQAIDSMISEIDLFKGFLDGYAKMDAKPEAKAPAAVKEPVPADGKAPASGAELEAKKTVTTLPEEAPAGTEAH